MIHFDDWLLKADAGPVIARQYDNLTRRLEILGDIPEGWSWTLLVQAVTPLEIQPPDMEGMLAIYRPVEREHTGTMADPIPWVSGMDCVEGKYYGYNGKTYRVAEGGTMSPCVWPPDTPDMWQWEVVS